MATNRGVVLLGDRHLEIREKPVPEPTGDEVLVRMKASGICGSDLHGLYQRSRAEMDAWRQRLGGQWWFSGHEPCGVVEAIGSTVTQVRPGDRVLIDHVIACGTCKYCRTGQQFHCTNRRLSLGFGIDGGHADFVLTRDRSCVRMPDHLSFIDGAYISCAASTSFRVTQRLGVSGLDTVVCYGLGPVGLSGLVFARAMGARVVAVDVVPERMALARELGAWQVIDARQQNPVAAIRELTDGQGAEVAIDYSANPQARNNALDCVGIYGRVAFVGEGNQTTFNISPQIIHKDLTIIGSWVYGTATLYEISEFIKRHHIDLGRLVTHTFRLEQAEEAFRLFDGATTGKLVFVWPG